MNNKLICVCGMCGAGKSEVSEYFKSRGDFGYIRFGQVVLDEVKKISNKPSEALEREIRERFRSEMGMAAIAIKNIPIIERELQKISVVADGLYSWEEYLVLKEKFPNNMVVIAVYAPPLVRYARLSGRAKRHGSDEGLRFRSFSKEQAESRDKAEIENLHKAGPIAMADYTIINDKNIEDLKKSCEKVYTNIFVD
jgi:dephospho-CoA kinase